MAGTAPGSGGGDPAVPRGQAAASARGADGSADAAVRLPAGRPRRRRRVPGRPSSAARSLDTAARADALRAALGAWRGAAYDGLRDLAPLAAEGERLDEQHVVATLACVDAEHELGRAGGHVDELDALVRRHRVNEQLWARLMRALYAADRQADTLAAYQRARVALRDELGIEPGEALRQVEHLVLTQDPSLRPGTTGPPTDGGQERRRVTVLAAEVADDEEGTADPEVAAAASRRVALRSVVERYGGLLLPSPG